MFFVKRILPIILACILVATGVALFFVFRKNDEPKTKNGIKITNISLFKNGTSNYKILIPLKPSSGETQAANEVQTIFQKTTGFNLPIEKESNTYTTKDNIISIGNTNLFKTTNINLAEIDFNNDGFLIKRFDNTIVINATVDVGKIHGAHRFCELNMDYMYYAENCVKYVKTNNLKLLDFDLIDIPNFQGRLSYTYEILNSIDNRVNLYASLSSNSYQSKYQSLWSNLNDQSMTHQILPLKTYYADHNNWYYVKPDANINDLYSADEEVSSTFLRTKTQLCYYEALRSKGESGGLYETFLNNLINNYISPQTTKTMFMLGMSDNKLVCDCANCTASNQQYTVAGTCMRFINSIARDVKNWQTQNCPDREINIVVFAYQSTQEAPVKLNNNTYEPADPTVIAEDNVIVRIAPIQSCHFYAFNDKEHNELSANMLELWQLCASKFAIWDYKFNFTTQISSLPTWNAVETNLRTYKQMGVIDILSQAYPKTENAEFVELDNYVRSRLMWDTSLSYKTLAYDFIDNYYAEAAPYIKEYFELLNNHYTTHIMPKLSKMSIYTDTMKANYWPMETLMQIQTIFTKAYHSIDNLSATKKLTLKARIDQESAFYKYALIDLYGNQVYTTEELKSAINHLLDIKNNIISHPLRLTTLEEIVLTWNIKYNLT